MKRFKWLVPTLYIIFLMLPIYWLINMSFKTTNEILGGFALWPQKFTLENYAVIFTDSTWYNGYINSLLYVVTNTIISVTVALPAAYAFSRYRFLGDKHLFFWLLTNRMAPPAVFVLPFFQLYQAINLFDTHWAVALAHCLFNIPLAVWILEGFMSGVPKELDETAYIDGYSFPRFFVKIFIPSITAGIGVAAFFCFMFSWVELLLAKNLTAVAAKPIAATMTRTARALPWDGSNVSFLSWMAWTWQTAAFFAAIALALVVMTLWERASPGGAPRRGVLGLDTTRGDRLFISLLGSAFIHLLWLAFFGTPLWGAVVISLIYAVSVFRWV